MYETFYGLKESPFRLTPDPHYLYLSAHHREALGHLLFGIREGSGFIAVTGEIGTGKTTLLRALLRDLESNTVVAYIFNPALSDVELLQTINSEFRLPAQSTSKKDLVDALNRFLVEQKLADRRVVVIVDEAQNLAPTVLEQLRLLSNLETETEKLLQIVLVGQPELRDMLGRTDLKQLNQRITVRWHLAPLDADETAGYVRHRMRIAGGTGAVGVFRPAALRLLYRYSRGVPRLINIGAQRALLLGFTRERRAIDARLMRRAIRELRRDDAARTPRARLLKPALGAAAGAAAAALVLSFSLVPRFPASRAPAVPTDGGSTGSTEPASLVPATPAEPRRDPGAGEQVAVAVPDGDLPEPAVAPLAATLATPGGAGAVAASPAPSPQAESAVLAPSPAARTSPATDSVSAPAAGTATAAPSDPSAAAAAVVAATTVPSIAVSPVAPTTRAWNTATFWSALARTDSRSAAALAVAGLLTTWGVEPLRPDERAQATLDLQSIARRRGLRYLATSGTLSRLAQLNLPAILDLSVPPARQRRFAVLVGLDGERTVLRFGDVETSLGVKEIAEVWLGDAHLFWRDFESLPAYLAPGSIGPEVERLQTLLMQVGEYGSRTSSTYDRTTAEALARFQRSHRLSPDGILGPLTKIALYGAIADYDLPRLSGDT